MASGIVSQYDAKSVHRLRAIQAVGSRTEPRNLSEASAEDKGPRGGRSSCGAGPFWGAAGPRRGPVIGSYALPNGTPKVTATLMVGPGEGLRRTPDITITCVGGSAPILQISEATIVPNGSHSPAEVWR